jgi:DNA/RNA-binding domain of Phe-tRNA-synthetase-like protein
MITFEKDVEKIYPGTNLGVLIVKGISERVECKKEDEAIFLEELMVKYKGFTRKELKGQSPVDAYAAYYKKFGQSYHLLAQLDSMLRGEKTCGSKSPLLQSMFFNELESMMLTAGYDLNRLKPPLCLNLAAGNEGYQSISGREVTAAAGDIILSDSSRVFSSILKGPDYDTRITPDTTDVLFIIYAPPGIGAFKVKTALIKLEDRIRAFAPDSITEILHVLPFSTC